MIGFFDGLDPVNPSNRPTTKQMFELGETNTQYFIDEIISKTTSTYYVFLLVKDLLKNGGT